MHICKISSISNFLNQCLYIERLASYSNWLFAFGTILDNRNFGNSPRVGFNGKEKDDEIKGIGNSLDFGARIYDSRLGRWLSVDPYKDKYHSLSPYNFGSNSPLYYIDIDGNDITPSTDFKSSNYFKAYQYLCNSNTVYKQLITKYENNKKFNLQLGTDDTKVSSGAGATTSYKYNYSCSDNTCKKRIATTSIEASSHFMSSESSGDVKLWHFYILVHEATHSFEPTDPYTPDLNNNSDHGAFEAFLSKTIGAFTELSKDLNLGWTDEQIKEVALFGAEETATFKKYIEEKAKANGTKVEEEKAKYETRVNDLLSKTIEIPKTTTTSTPSKEAQPVKKTSANTKKQGTSSTEKKNPVKKK